MNPEAPRATRGVERRVISRFWEFDQGGAWVVEEPYDVAFKDVGWFGSLIIPSHQKSSMEWYQMGGSNS